MISVALIGCGKIGSRHLQSIIKLNFETKIYLVDPKKESINICLNLIENDLEKSQKENIKIYSEINEIPSDIDFAIVATDSKPGLHDQVVSFIEFCKYKTFDYRLATIFDAKRALNSIINIENLIKQ